MSGEYHAVVSNEFSTTTSETATVVVNPDIVPPELTGLSSSPLLNQVFATFSENVDISGATMTLATEGGDAIEVLGASASGSAVSIDTEELDAGTRYVVTFADVADLAETPNTASGTDSFLSNARRSGGLTYLFYELGGGGLGFLADAEPGEYPEGFNAFGPGDSLTNIRNRQSGSSTYFEVPASGDINVNPPGDVANNYGAIAFGHIRPQATGDYRFFIAVDDNAQLWLSESADPEDADIIANEPGWNGVRQYDDGKEDNWSDPIPLVAGEEYYIELRWSEGGGGDNAAVTWTFTDDGTEPPVPSNGSNPIGAEFLISNLPIFDDVTWVASPGNGSAGVLVDSGSFSITLTDGFLTKVDPDTIMATVGGEAISLTVVTDDEGNHTASGSVSGNFPVNAEVPVEVTFSTTDGGSETISYTFQTEDLPVLNAAWATPFDEVGDRGHNVRVVQALDSAGRANSTDAAEAQLQDNNPPAIFEGSGIFDVINFNQDVDSGGGNGVFRGGSPTAAYQIADMNLAEEGLLTDSADTDDENHTNDWAMEVTSYLAFTEAGIYTMGVNSDDGFRVTAGRTVDPAESTLEIGVFNGGRGAANDAFQSTFRTLVSEPGVYAFRFIGYEGGGGSSMEWYSIDGSDAALINGEGGIASYVSRASDPDPVTDAVISSVSVDDAGNLTIEYTGTLQSATAVTGPYADVAGASSPYTTTPGDLMFFRVQ